MTSSTCAMPADLCEVVQHKAEETGELLEKKKKGSQPAVTFPVIIIVALHIGHQGAISHSHLQLILLASVLDGLEYAPGVPASYFQPGHVAPVPTLDQDGRLHGYKM